MSDQRLMWRGLDIEGLGAYAQIVAGGPPSFRHAATARRLGFLVGHEWAWTRRRVRAIRGVLGIVAQGIRWNRRERCYAVVCSTVLTGYVQRMALTGTIEA